MTHDAPRPTGSALDEPSRPGERVYWLDSSRNVDKVFYGLCLLCILIAAGDLLVHRHVVFAAEAMFSFYGVYGFVACVALVLAAKELRKYIKRNEKYYGDDS